MGYEEEYDEEQAGRIFDSAVKAAIGVGLLGALGVGTGLACFDVCRELLSYGWDCFIDCINKDY